jgi:hypothetical protein
MNEPGQDAKLQLELGGAHLERTFLFNDSIALAQILLITILFLNYLKASGLSVRPSVRLVRPSIRHIR